MLFLQFFYLHRYFPKLSNEENVIFFSNSNINNLEISYREADPDRGMTKKISKDEKGVTSILNWGFMNGEIKKLKVNKNILEIWVVVKVNQRELDQKELQERKNQTLLLNQLLSSKPLL
jgi:hypothetical protein